MNKWPLADSNFNLIDKLKICKFILNSKNRWTQDKYMQKFERQFADCVGVKYAVQTSSGSTANTLLAMYVKDTLGPKFNTSNIVVLPAVTWQTSASPWIREGFRPKFIDISLDDFSMDLAQLEELLKQQNSEIACVFITSLIGFVPNIAGILRLSEKYNVRVMLDNCENTFGKYIYNEKDSNMRGLKKPYSVSSRHKFGREQTVGGGCSKLRFGKAASDLRGDVLSGTLTRKSCSQHSQNQFGAPSNISSFFTSTTSCYIGHYINAIETGFIFTNNKKEYEYFLMARNHGMTRWLRNTTFGDCDYKSYQNDNVDWRFDFNCLGNNFRSTDVNAFIGLLDFKKKDFYIKKRLELYNLFKKNLNLEKYLLPSDDESRFNVPFCLPIILREDSHKKQQIVKYCDKNNIESRPIISGFLGYHTPYRKYMNASEYPNAVHMHNFGLYVGLHNKVRKKRILELVDFLNKV